MHLFCLWNKGERTDHRLFSIQFCCIWWVWLARFLWTRMQNTLESCQEEKKDKLKVRERSRSSSEQKSEVTSYNSAFKWVVCSDMFAWHISWVEIRKLPQVNFMSDRKKKKPTKNHTPYCNTKLLEGLLHCDYLGHNVHLKPNTQLQSNTL